MALATAVSYVVWLGWDQSRDMNPVTGRATGPYEEWQIVGLVLSLAIAVAAAAWRGHPWVAGIVVPVVMTFCWSWDAATGPGGPGVEGPSLWQIGAILVALGTFGGAALVAGLGVLTRRVQQRAAPSKGY